MREAVGPTIVWASLALVGAALVAPHLAAPAAAVAVALGLLAVGLALRRSRRRRWFAAVAIVLTAAGVAGLRFARIDAGLLPQLAAGHRSVEVVATVAAEPRVAHGRWWTIVRVERAGAAAVRERAFLRGSGPPPVLGTRWRGRVLVRPLPDGDFGRYLRRQYVSTTVVPVRWQPVARAGAVGRSTEWVRARTRAAADRALPRDHAGLAVGLVTGDTRLLSAEREEALRDTGLSHLVAVSGSNVAIVLAGAGGLAALAGLGARPRRYALVATLVWFTVLTRWEPSVLRAAAVAGVVLLVGHRGQLVDARHALAVAILLLVLVDPGIAGSLGLLLSASAAAGVLVVGPALRPRLDRLPSRVADLVAATLGAQIAVAPVLLLTAGEVPLSSVPANLVAVPAAAVASALAAAGALVAAVSIPAAAPLFAVAQPALTVVIWAGERFRWWGGVVAWGEPLTALAAVAGTIWLLVRSPRPRRLAGVAALALTAAAAVPPGVLRPPPRTLVVTAIDVGQGDAILVEAPGVRFVVDGGPDERAARWLRRNVRGPLDVAVLSHPHADHADGLPLVLARIGARALWLPDLPSDLPSVAQALAWARRTRTPVAHPETGQSLQLGPLSIDVLGPPTDRPYRTEQSEPNETSLVLRVRYGAQVALLTGDAERAAQRDLRRLHDLRAGYLKVPHHGGNTSQGGFFASVAPVVAVISAGRGNRYGHPHPDVLTALDASGAVVRRTDRDGTVRTEVPVTGAELATPPAPPRPPSLPSAHAGPGLPRHLRRRAPAHTRGRRRPRRTHHRDARPRGRARGRRVARAPPRTPHGIALRRRAVRRPARRRDAVGGPREGGRRRHLGSSARCRPRPRREGHRPHPEDREGRGGGRRTP